MSIGSNCFWAQYVWFEFDCVNFCSPILEGPYMDIIDMHCQEYESNILAI